MPLSLSKTNISGLAANFGDLVTVLCDEGYVFNQNTRDTMFTTSCYSNGSWPTDQQCIGILVMPKFSLNMMLGSFGIFPIEPSVNVIMLFVLGIVFRYSKKYSTHAIILIL